MESRYYIGLDVRQAQDQLLREGWQRQAILVDQESRQLFSKAMWF
jgi:hypothetical protein